MFEQSCVLNLHFRLALCLIKNEDTVVTMFLHPWPRISCTGSWFWITNCKIPQPGCSSLTWRANLFSRGSPVFNNNILQKSLTCYQCDTIWALDQFQWRKILFLQTPIIFQPIVFFQFCVNSFSLSLSCFNNFCSTISCRRTSLAARASNSSNTFWN